MECRQCCSGPGVGRIREASWRNTKAAVTFYEVEALVHSMIAVQCRVGGEERLPEIYFVSLRKKR